MLCRRLLALVAAGAGLLSAQGFVEVSRRHPRYLELSSGEAFVPIGLNIAWERFATEEREVFAKTEARFRFLGSNGGNFARVFLSHPFYDFDPDAPRAEVESKLRRIDRLVELAARHGIRLKLCVEHFRTMEPRPVMFPGSVSFGRPELAGRFVNMTAFFREGPGRAWFLRKLDVLAARYAENPAIAAWELWNEINAAQGQGWEEWTRDMLPELKRRFPRQLALQSLGSFDRPVQVENYRRFSAMPGNEMAQAHRYHDPGAQFEVCHGPMDVLAADAVTQLRSYTQDRPVLLSEVGAVEAHHAGPSKRYDEDREGVLLHDGLFAGFFAGGAGPGQFWHWQDYVEKHNLWFHFARFAEAIRGIDPRVERFEPERLESAAGLRVYALRGAKRDWMWVRAAGDQAVHGAVVRWRRGGTVEIYDPWTGKKVKVRVKGGSVALPEFRRSVVVRSA